LLAVVLLFGALAPLLYFGPHVLRLVGQSRLQRLCSEHRALVLTYDDGPGKILTAPLLDLLDAYDARATFFFLGMRATRHPEMADHVASRGHELSCHSQRHLHAWKEAPWSIFSDVEQGYQTLSPWLATDAMFRPPYGKLSLANWLSVALRGARFGWWTIDAGDTHEPLPEVDTAAKRLREHGGGVVLLHDFDRDPEANAFVLRATETLLVQARTDGFAVMSLGELLARAKTTPAITGNNR
jgi:peptidoglycan/xylan/chitin deacetylase (PgdA/CDA1 family)